MTEPTLTEADRRRRPPLALAAAEGPRALGELLSLGAFGPLLASAPRGDGHPVLVLPGLLADDGYMALLRLFLRMQGWQPLPWAAGTNFGDWASLETRVLPAIEAAVREHGRPVSLVGASMGGLYARAAAHRLPGHVRCVVTLASPVHGPYRANNIWPMFEAGTGQPAETMAVPPPAVVPSTSVYSRSDGLGDWTPCLQPPGAVAENVEIASSHLGMAWHPAALFLLADRLAQPLGRWQPFSPPGWARWLYPAPGGGEFQSASGGAEPRPERPGLLAQ